MLLGIDPVTILLGILTFIGTKSNQAVDQHYQLQNTKIELMKDMCFIQKDCSALNAFLAPQVQPTNPIQALQNITLPSDGVLAPIILPPQDVQSAPDVKLPAIIPVNPITAPNPYSGNIVK